MIPVEEQEPEKLPGWAWLFPIFFGPIGGIGAFIAFRKRKNAGWLLAVGFMVSALIYGLSYNSVSYDIPDLDPVEPESYSVYLPLPEGSSITYTNYKPSYSLRYLRSWEKVEDFTWLGYTYDVVFIGPYFPSSEISVVIVIGTYTDYTIGQTTLESYVNLAEVQAVQDLEYPYKEVSRQEGGRISGCRSLLVTGDVTYADGSIERDTAAYFILDNTAYVITYCAPLEEYDNYYSIFTGMLGSFEIKE